MSKLYAITNQKGGVGKSTTCACLGAALTELGNSVLMVDLDPQSGLTTSLGVLTTNALMATQRVIVPVQSEYLALRGLKQLHTIITKVKKKGNPVHCSVTSYTNLRIPMLEFRGADSRLNRAKFMPLMPVGQLLHCSTTS